MKSLLVLTTLALVSPAGHSKNNTFSAHRDEIIAVTLPAMELRVWPNDKAAAKQAAICISDVMIAAAEQLKCPFNKDAVASMDLCIQNSRHIRRVIASWLPDCAYAAKHHFEIPKVAK